MNRILLLCWLFSFSWPSLAQQAVWINENFQKTPVQQVLDLLEEKYHLQVAYDYASVEGIIINKNINNQSLESALEALFSDTALEFQLLDGQRLLVRKKQETPLSYSTSERKTITVSGVVMDKISGTPLPYATVYCPVTQTGCSTDEQGRFSLSLTSDVAEGTISIQYLGYVSNVIQWNINQPEHKVQVQLVSKSLQFEAITIEEQMSAFSYHQSDGGITLRKKEDALRLLGAPTGEDLFRQAQMLPGIDASDDVSSELKIRGGDGSENMIIVDGITLYKADHYFGVFSAINSGIIDRMDIYKNAFPAEFGGRTSGVVDLHTLPVVSGNLVKGQIQLDLLTTTANLQVPINKNMGILLGGRTTNMNIANTELFQLLENNNGVLTETTLEGDPHFRFYDFNAKWEWRIQPATRLTLSGFLGKDDFYYDYQRDIFTKEGEKGSITNAEDYEEEVTWNNRGISAQLSHGWSKRFKSTLTFGSSSYQENQKISSELIRTIEPAAMPGRPIPPITNEIRELENQTGNTINGYELGVKNSWELSKKEELTFGYHYLHNQVDFFLDVDGNRPINQFSNGNQNAVYAEYDRQLLEGKLHTSLGLRTTHYDLTRQLYWSPRVSLNYQLSDELQIKGAWSRYYQFLRENYREDRFGRSYEFWTLGDDKGRFPVSSSSQFMAGFSWLSELIEVDVEAWHKNLDGVIEFALEINGFAPDKLAPPDGRRYAIYNGTGISKGIDVLVRKQSKNWTSWVAYTLSKVTNSFSEIQQGTPYPAQNDRRHQLKWVNEYRWKNFDFSLAYVFSSGSPYLDLTKLNGPIDRGDTPFERRISYLPDYHRIDLGAAYNFNWQKNSATLGISLFNLLDRKNVKQRQFIYSLPDESSNKERNTIILGTEQRLLGFTPNISFKLDF